VPSLPLIVGSIMSKKLALGAGTLILDVKWGTGAFRKSVEEAKELAEALKAVAVETGVRCDALITDMNQPLGPALGTACEVRQALAVLVGEGDEGLLDVTVRLSREALVMQGWEGHEAEHALREAIEDGSALAAWERMVEAHGGDPDPDLLARPRETIEVAAVADGWVAACDGEDLGRVAARVGAGRSRVDEPLAHGAGVIVRAGLGDAIERGQPLATLLVGEREIDVEQTVARIRDAFTISPDKVEAPTLVLGTVDEL
jgi:thymidine phosphorylase